MTQRSIALVLLIAVGGVAGCKSIDPARDQERAALLVSERVKSLGSHEWPSVNPEAEWDGRADLHADSAVRVALAAHPAIRAAMDHIAASRADLVQSGLLPNPVLNISLGFPLGGESGATSVGVGLVQQLAWLLTARSRQDAASSDLDASVLLASDQALAIAAEVRNLHARIVFAQSFVTEHMAAADSARRALELARRAAAAGEATTLEINRRSTRLIELEHLTVAAQADLDVFKRELLHRLHRSAAAADWRAADPPDRAPIAEWTEQQVIELARDQRLDVAAAKARADAARIRAGISKSEVWADLEAGAGFSRDEDAREELGPEISVPIPIFDTGQARTARSAAEARVAASEAEVTRSRAVADARRAWVRARSAHELLQSSGARLVETADQSLDLSRRAFAAGALELTGLLEAEEQAVQARIRALELKRDAVLEHIELERAVGGRLAR